MAVICLAIIALVTAADLSVKWWVEKNFVFRKDKEILAGHGIMRKVHNKGLMMGLGEKHREVVKALSGAATAGILAMQFILIEKPGYIKEKIGLSLIIGGAVSNTFDRLKRGYVVDYFGFNCKNKKVSRVTFNIGDFAIFAGGILLAISAIIGTKE